MTLGELLAGGRLRKNRCLLRSRSEGHRPGVRFAPGRKGFCVFRVRGSPCRRPALRAGRTRKRRLRRCERTPAPGRFRRTLDRSRARPPRPGFGFAKLLWPSGPRIHFTGITGTNGKTTTSYLLEAILQEAGNVTGLIGTIEYRLAGEVRRALEHHSGIARRDALRSRAGTTRGHASDLRGLLTRTGAGAGLRVPLPYRRFHQPHAGSSGFSWIHGRIRRGKAAAVCSEGGPSRRSGRC